jgi:hypothetical protein
MRWNQWLFSVALSGIAILMPGLCMARTLVVPDSFPSIQAAFDSVRDNDTVFAAPGTYAESLIAPPHRFLLRGQIVPVHNADTLRSVIDISTLPGCSTLASITISQRTVFSIEDFSIRNGPEVYRRSQLHSNGILCNADSLVVMNCLFDSVSGPIVAQHNGEVISLDHCRFQHCSYYLVYASLSQVNAAGCVFTGCSIEALVKAGDNSTFEDCEFRGEDHFSLLYMIGTRNVVRSCRFLSGGGDAYTPVTFGCGVFENNVFSGAYRWYGVLFLHRSLAQPGCTTEVSGNLFLPNLGSATGWGTGAIRVPADSGHAVLISNNTFDGCSARGYSNAMEVEGDVLVTGNRFLNMPDNGQAAVAIGYQGSPVFRGNAFIRTHIALDCISEMPSWPDSFDARMNFWGDSSGPYNDVLNPRGQGDEVIGHRILIRPWLTDTTEAVPSRDASLPQELTLSVFPNPFNATTVISFAVPHEGLVKLLLYDITGRLARVIQDERIEAGEHRVLLNAEGVASGIYFVRLESGRIAKTVKMAVVK